MLRTLQFLLLILAFIFLANPGISQNSSATNQRWMRDYDELHEYDGIYVGKKIDVNCRVYETFLLDANGKKRTPGFRDIAEFSDGLAEFVPQELNGSGQGLHGFINRQGEIVIPATYLATDLFYNGRTWVIYPAGKQYGISFIDTKGNVLYRIPIEHYKNDFLIEKAKVDFICSHDCKEDIIWWKKDELFILNWKFSPFIEKEIKNAKGIYHFKYKGKYGIIDKNMILRVPVALDDIDPAYKFSGQGMERVKYNDTYGYVSPYTGELIVPFQFTDTRKPTAGLFWVKKNNKWGCIDKTGRTKIEFLYDEATGFTSENRSAVAINGKFGHIDKAGKVKTPLQYDFASYYNHGVSMVRIDDKYGYIDTTGRFVTEAIYDEALPFDNLTTVVERMGLRFRLSLNGEERFIGFSYVWNAIFILMAVVLFIWLNNKFYRHVQTTKAIRKF